MTNIVEHPRAVELARKMEREAERTAREAQEKAERAEHRKWLKESKPERDAERAWCRRLDAAKRRISEAVWEGADAVYENATDASAASPEAVKDQALFAIYD